MRKYVRVRDTSGHEISVYADVPDGHPRGVQEGQRVLDDKDALGRNGEPLPPKYRTSLGQPLPGSKADRKRTTKKPVPAADPAPENTDGRTADSDEENH